MKKILSAIIVNYRELSGRVELSVCETSALIMMNRFLKRNAVPQGAVKWCNLWNQY